MILIIKHNGIRQELNVISYNEVIDCMKEFIIEHSSFEDEFIEFELKGEFKVESKIVYKSNLSCLFG